MTLAQLFALLNGSAPRERQPKELTPAQRERLRRSPMMQSGLIQAI